MNPDDPNDMREKSTMPPLGVGYPQDLPPPTELPEDATEQDVLARFPSATDIQVDMTLRMHLLSGVVMRLNDQIAPLVHMLEESDVPGTPRIVRQFEEIMKKHVTLFLDRDSAREKALEEQDARIDDHEDRITKLEKQVFKKASVA